MKDKLKVAFTNDLDINVLDNDFYFLLFNHVADQ